MTVLSLLFFYNLTALFAGLGATLKNYPFTIRYVFIIFISLISAFFIVQRDFDYGDTLAYTEYYNYSHNFIEFELLFDGLAKVFIYIFPGQPLFFLLFCSFVTVILLLSVSINIFKFSNGLIFFWILVSTYSFYYLTFEVIRQGLAFSFLLLGVSYLLKENCWRKYFLFLLIGAGFHSSILIFVFLPVTYFIRNVYSYLFFLVLVFFFGYISIVMLEALPSYLPLINKLVYYKDFDYISDTILIRFLFFLFLSFLILKSNFDYKVKNLIVFYMLLLVVTYHFEEIHRRYLIVAPIFFLIPVFTFCIKSKLVGHSILLSFLYFVLFLINYRAMYGLLNFEPILMLG